MMITADSKFATGATPTLVGSAVLLALTGYAVSRYPASLDAGGTQSLTLLVGACICYGLAAAGARRARAESRVALSTGAAIGIALGAAAGAHTAAESFLSMPAGLAVTAGAGMWGLMFVLFGAAGSSTFARSGSFYLAVLASAWAAIVSTIITCLAGFGMNLAFMPHMQQVLSGDPSFVVRNTLTAASTHLVLAPLIAIAFGLLGAVASAIVRALSKRAAIALAAGAFVLLIGGAVSIHAASGRARPDRPPFIMAGLLMAGVSLAGAHALATGARAPNPADSGGDETKSVLRR